MSADAAIEAAVTRALECVAEWTDIIGRVSVSAHEHSAFTSELADAIRGVER